MAVFKLSPKDYKANLYDLLPAGFDKQGFNWPDVTGLYADSRTVTKGSCFLAVEGENCHGSQFIADASRRGAKAIIQEVKNANRSVEHQNVNGNQICIVTVPNLKEHVGHIASAYYKNPSQQMTVIGYTGTNGKTTASYLQNEVLSNMHKSSALIGTLGVSMNNSSQETELTTPTASDLQRYMACFRDSGAEMVAMEVSSSGIEQSRIDGVAIDVGVCLSFSRDHMDQHGTMENYAALKEKLFYHPGLRHGVFNLNDPFCLQLCQKVSRHLDIVGYALNPQGVHFDGPLVSVEQITQQSGKNLVEINTPWGEGKFTSHLLTDYNVSNQLAVLSVLGHLGYPLDLICHGLSKVKKIPGRMQVFLGTKESQPLL